MSSSKIFVEPAALYFPPPLTRNITNVLTFWNSSDKPVVFKVHSSEPELYAVKPSSGLVASKAAARITITFRKLAADPDNIAEMNKKQRFKVRAKAVPANLYADGTANPPLITAGDVWKKCDALPVEMDTTLTCSFKGDVGNGANVTFDGASAANNARTSVEDPYATAKRSGAAGAAAKNVSFGADNTGAGGNAPLKSNLKTDGSVSPRNAGDVVSSESATIKANSQTKKAVADSINDHNDRKAQIEREIKEKQAVLQSLQAAEAAAQKNAAANGEKKPTKKSKGLPLSVAMITMIACYVGGAITRVSVGADEADRYVAAVVPEPVRTTLTNAKASMDEQVECMLGSFGSFSSGSAAAESAPVVADGVIAAAEEAAVVVPKAEVVPPVVEEVPVVAEPEAPAKAVEEPAAAPAAEAPAGEKKKRRRRKVKKSH